MALNAVTLISLLKQIRPGEAIASLGYPDIICPPANLAQLVGDRQISYRPDSEKICKRHGIEQHQVPDAESLFEAFGASLDVYDIVRERGSEIVLDLNEPFPENSREQYDYVLDVGTLEHCFNVAQALKNAAAMVKVGGQIHHENPFNWGNHGFYSLHPTLYHDFYEANGFRVDSCRLTGRDYGQTDELGPGRFQFSGKEVVLLTSATRLEVRPFVNPTQTKYQEKK